MISVAIKRILKETEQNENDIFGEKDMFDCILGSENMKTLYATAEEAVGKISDYAAETNKKNIDSLVVQIMKYINDNLYSDISINDVIDEFGISASYLTKLLKNSYNISFKKYVNDARISKAKQIMNDDKTVQIQDVASRVGFNSSVSFIRAFKRIEGITPKQYLDL